MLKINKNAYVQALHKDGCWYHCWANASYESKTENDYADFLISHRFINGEPIEMFIDFYYCDENGWIICNFDKKENIPFSIFDGAFIFAYIKGPEKYFVDSVAWYIPIGFYSYIFEEEVNNAVIAWRPMLLPVGK